MQEIFGEEEAAGRKVLGEINEELRVSSKATRESE